ncbi:MULTISPECIES: MgtC/SapB family protein [unclassified Mycolicibacterium]|uniref:MgtC/SapB family protein n=1 Tax=unclassified Mycolicibacterium TaxID=2636767 RepID=UPI002EDB03C9
MSWLHFVPFLVALAIGLLLGFERERSHTRNLPAGSRSFALLALAGAVAAAIDPWAVAAGAIGVAALMTAAYVRTSTDDPGTTTEIAGLVAYLLGALAYSRPAEAVALAVVVAGLLVSKARIHRFIREIVSEIELEDAIKFFVVAFVILPLLPDRPLGPYGVLNPAKVWLLVVLLTGIGWVGYIGVRALGPQRGLLVTGMAGGFVSASATTASMGRLSRTESGLRAPLASALVASLATFVQLLMVIGVVDIDVLRRLWPPVVAGALVLVGIAAFVYRGAHGPEHDSGEAPAQPTNRPFALRPAIVLAAVLTLALLVSRWAADVLGPNGLVLTAFAAGLADAHAGAVAAASLAATGAVTVDAALIAIGAALGSNLLVKAILAFTAGGRRFGLAFLAGMAAPAIVFGVALTLAVTLV